MSDAVNLTIEVRIYKINKNISGHLFAAFHTQVCLLIFQFWRKVPIPIFIEIYNCLLDAFFGIS